MKKLLAISSVLFGLSSALLLLYSMDSSEYAHHLGRAIVSALASATLAIGAFVYPNK